MQAGMSVMGQPPLDLWLSTLDQRMGLGMRVEVYDDYFGWGEFVYAKLATSTLAAGTVVTLDDSFAMTAAASTAGLGRPVGVLKTKMDASAGVAYGFVQIAGLAPATFSVAATVGAVYLGTAGNFTPTAANGKQVLNAYTIAAATKNFTRTITTRAGSPEISTSGLSGLFPGMALSGTGIPGGTTVLNLDATRRTQFNASANATASGTVTGTFTYTGFGLVQLNRPFSQGQVV